VQDGEAWGIRYALDFSAILTVDRAGLLLDYPGIAVRVA
jgi:hypothetical protein